MSFLNDSEFSKLYFYPQDVLCESAIDIEVNGVVLRCLHHQSDPSLPTLVHFHGNGEAVGHYVQMGYVPKLLSEVGDMNILLVEYRGYGGSSGTPQLVAMIDDGEALLRALNLDPAHCVVYGRSIGSLYALEMAARFPNLGGLFIDSGIAGVQSPFLNRMLNGLVTPEGIERRKLIQAEVQQHFNHQAKIAAFQGKLVICHTAKDYIIRAEEAKQLYLWATTSKKELRLYREGDHNSIFHFNGSDMHFALKRLMASITPEQFPLPEKSEDEMLQAAFTRGNRYIREADVYSPTLDGWTDPRKPPRPDWMLPLPEIEPMKSPLDVQHTVVEPKPQRNLVEGLMRWLSRK